MDKEAQMKPKCGLPIATAQILKDPFQWNQNEKSVACRASTLRYSVISIIPTDSHMSGHGHVK